MPWALTSSVMRMPDDPEEGKPSKTRWINDAPAPEAKLIRALFVLYDKEAIANPDARDQAYLAAVR